MPKKLSSRQDITDFLKSLDINVFGLGVLAYDATGLEDVLDNFQVVSLRKTKDDEAIRKNIKLTVLEDIIGEDVNEVRQNSVSLLRDKNIIDYISKHKNPILFSYKGRKTFEEIADQNKFVNATASSELYKYYNDKRQFRLEAEKAGLRVPLNKLLENLDNVNFEDLKKEFGLPFVFQYVGKHTFFIKTEEEFNEKVGEAKKLFAKRIEKGKVEDNDVLISQFIEGKAASVSCIATRWGTFVSNLQYQIIGIPEFMPAEPDDKGMYCGIEWTSAGEITEISNTQAKEMGKAFGEHLYSKGYRGFFGLDVLIEDKTGDIYVNECNPRFTGVLPTIDHIQNSVSSIPLTALHLLEFIPDIFPEIEFELDHDLLNKELGMLKKGAHFHLSTPVIEKDSKSVTELKCGVYSYNGTTFEFKKEGYEIKNMAGENEFILCELHKTKLLSSNDRLCRIITLNYVLADDKARINDWGKTICNFIYENVSFKSNA